MPAAAPPPANSPGMALPCHAHAPARRYRPVDHPAYGTTPAQPCSRKRALTSGPSPKSRRPNVSGADLPAAVLKAVTCGAQLGRASRFRTSQQARPVLSALRHTAETDEFHELLLKRGDFENALVEDREGIIALFQHRHAQSRNSPGSHRRTVAHWPRPAFRPFRSWSRTGGYRAGRRPRHSPDRRPCWRAQHRPCGPSAPPRHATPARRNTARRRSPGNIASPAPDRRQSR